MAPPRSSTKRTVSASTPSCSSPSRPTSCAGPSRRSWRTVRRDAMVAMGRALGVGSGLVYDYIFDRFGPYRALQQEVLDVVRAAADGKSLRDVRVLDIGCGPGNFSL